MSCGLKFQEFNVNAMKEYSGYGTTVQYSTKFMFGQYQPHKLAKSLPDLAGNYIRGGVAANKDFVFQRMSYQTSVISWGFEMWVDTAAHAAYEFGLNPNLSTDARWQAGKDQMYTYGLSCEPYPWAWWENRPAILHMPGREGPDAYYRTNNCFIFHNFGGYLWATDVSLHGPYTYKWWAGVQAYQTDDLLCPYSELPDKWKISGFRIKGGTYQ